MGSVPFYTPRSRLIPKCKLQVMHLKTSDWIAAGSAFISFVSVLVSILFGRSTRRYAREQIELAKKQFAADKTPDVEVKVFCQRKKPGTHDMEMGLFLQATNHHPTIPVNQLSVFLLVEKIGDCSGCSFMFPTFSDLKPGQTTKLESLQNFETMIPRIFPASTVKSSIIGDKLSAFMSMKDYEKYPAFLTVRFLPRVAAAAMIEREMEMYLFVERK